MARTNTVDVSEERNTFVLELLRAQPEIRSADVQERVKSKFGSAVTTRVLNQLRDQVQTELESREETDDQAEMEMESPMDGAVQSLKASASGSESQANSAPAQQKPRSAKGARVKHVFVESSKEQLDFLAQVLAQLQEAGVGNVRIDHGTERWLVFAVDAK